jgi:hypothetical protein
MKLPIVTFDQITKLREAAERSAADFPYRPLLVELAIMGLSRWAIAGLTVSSFKENVPGVFRGKPTILPYAVVWRERNNVNRVTRLSAAQWSIVRDYLSWRTRWVYVQSPCLFVAKTGNDDSYWKPMKPERVRSEIRTMGRETYISEEGLEIPDLHRGMANAMRLQGISEEIIQETYGKKIYSGTIRVLEE